MAGTTTAQDVFDTAMGLIDEINSSGSSDTSDTAEYKNKTLRLLNILRVELFPLSDTYSIITPGVRQVCPKIMDFTSVITGLDDVIAQGIMPYGLAAKLLVNENTAAVNYFQQTYDELKRTFKSPPAEFEAIDDVYNGIEYGGYSRW